MRRKRGASIAVASIFAASIALSSIGVAPSARASGPDFSTDQTANTAASLLAKDTPQN